MMKKPAGRDNGSAVAKTAASRTRSATGSPARKTPVAPPVTAASAPVPTPEASKRKPKLVRDGFTMPKAEYALIGELKERAVRLQRPAKKSELLRAGIAVLNAMSDEAFLAAMAAVPSLKTGRPKAAKSGEAAKAAA